MKNGMKYKILNILQSGAGEYVSGEKISRELNITRSAVWKNIAQLKNDGFEIDAVTNKGYTLVKKSVRLDINIAENMLKTKTLGKPMYVFDSVTSTFDKIAEFPRAEGLTVAARRQSNGRGRLGRSWDSGDGGIYFSFNLTPHTTPQDATFITVLCALAAANAIGNRCAIKWPNDIVINGKKVCGILTTMSVCEENLEYICVGIGINTNKTSFPHELTNASSIRNETGNECDENKLLCDILENVEKLYFSGNREKITEEYSKLCITLGSEVAVHFADGRESLHGTCTGINADGTLNVSSCGKTVTLNSGEVSVRGLYGYV